MSERSADATPPHWPQTRGQCFIELMVRDPDWAVAYWEVTPEAFEEGLHALRTFSAQARLSVRLYNLPRLSNGAQADEAAFVEAFEVNQWLGQRYLMLNRPDTFHSVAIGMTTDDGVFHALARSRWVCAPRNLPKTSEDPVFVRSSWKVQADLQATIEVREEDAS